MQGFIFREANESDIFDIYRHIHMEYVKKYFSENEAEQWKSHEKWYRFIINSPYFIIYILEDCNGEFLGQLRFELDDESAVVSIYLKKDVRGSGLGKKIIKKGIEKLKVYNSSIKVVLAYILEENESSIKTFESSGFSFEKYEEYHGVDHMLYIKKLKT